jgi:hypothetical protein
MSKLHDAMTLARTAPAHPVTITDQPGGRDYSWACPPECATTPCPITPRLRNADWTDLADRLPAGAYLAVPTLWGIELTDLDGAPTSDRESAGTEAPADETFPLLVGEQVAAYAAVVRLETWREVIDLLRRDSRPITAGLLEDHIAGEAEAAARAEKERHACRHTLTG